MNLKELPDFVQKMLIQIIENNGFSDYSVEIGSGSQAGDGFLSKLYKFTIAEEKHDKILVLVCKLAPMNKIHRKEFFSDILFNREALFYDKLMPIFDNFQVGKNVPEDNQFQSYPKCYGSLIDDENEQYTIILEDLRPQGYEMWNKAQPSPIENVRLAMRELGKFHGLSVAMKNQKPTEFSEFKQVTNAYIVFLQSKNVRGAHYAAYDRAIESLKSEDHRNIMHHIKDNLLAYVEDCFDDRASERFGVLCHGDFWNNNTLFQFNEHGAAEDIRCLDWQGIQYASPAIDLLYNIFTSTDKALRDKEYDNMLKYYHQSLCRTVKSLGSNPDELFTLDNLKDELRKCGNYALIMAPMLLQNSLADSSEITNLDEMFDRDEFTPELISGLSGQGKLEYDRRLNEVFEDICNLGYYRRID